MERSLTAEVFLLLAFLSHNMLSAQRRPDAIFGDYNGYWTSQTKTTPTPVVIPSDNNNIIGFTVGTTTYTTGVNDQAVRQRIPSAILENYRSFPVSFSVLNRESNFLIGMPRFVNKVEQTQTVSPSLPCGPSLGYYLRDGLNGLNIATAVFNIPAQDLNFLVNVLADINPTCIDDNIPDIIVTQVGEPANTTAGSDIFRFTDSNGTTVGNPITINFSTVDPSGEALWNFYSAGVASCPYPMYTAFSNTKRDIRMLTFKLSDFGITLDNYRSATKFVQKLSGQSDVAFSAYSTRSMSMYCLENAVSSGNALDTKIGITSQGRAGEDSSNNNWPMVRKGGYVALESNTKPFVPTRIATAELVNITNPVEGMMVYDTTANCLKIYVNSSIGWRCYNKKTCP